ncbi:hypothetical protein SORBI_3006G001700 [Sorghum bicolor]|uniref:Uncharacterized protein n=1 Tax=Sorghum bicolor TaxID=4558 RepID=A0A1B6PJC3_SORBI|nr:hypothetical protein SORBI_3006G001700 [Sorghum bicolor]
MADVNPLINGDLSGDDSSQSSNGSDSIVQPPSATILQTINIRHHIPVELNITESNYAKWQDFFDTFIGKFGLTSERSLFGFGN